MHLPPPLAATGLAPCPLGLSGWQRPARVQRTPVSGSHAAIGLFRTDCRPGLQDEGGICRKPQACGAARARPCPMTQRTPSCDRGLVEDFALNRCVPSEQSVLRRLADSALAEAQPLLKIAFGGLSCQSAPGKLALLHDALKRRDAVAAALAVSGWTCFQLLRQTASRPAAGCPLTRATPPC